MSKLIVPRYQTGFARYAAESKAPELWRGLVLALLPFLGVTGSGSGGRLPDMSGHNNDGTLNNMATPGTSSSGWWPTEMGMSVGFDGANDHIIVPDSPTMDIGTNDFTLLVWLRRDATNPSNWEGILLDKRVNTISHDGYFWGFYQDYQRFRIDTGAPAAVGNSNTKLSDTNNYHLVAISVVRTSLATFYLDGKPDGTLAVGTTSADISNNRDLHIGTSVDVGVNIQAHWASVYIYNRALSPNEIERHYSEPYVMWELARRPIWKTLGVTHSLTATAAAVTSTTGSLSVGNTEQMTATAAAVVSTAGTLTIGVTESMTATASAVVTTTGTLTIGVTESMTATAAAVVTTAGTLTIGVTESMTATAAAVVTTAGTLTIGVTESMTATAAAVVTTAGSLTLGETVSMTATAAAVTTATGRLTMLVTELSAFIRTSTEKAIGRYF